MVNKILHNNGNNFLGKICFEYSMKSTSFNENTSTFIIPRAESLRQKNNIAPRDKYALAEV
jgi:hypothetical protein